MDLGSTQKFSVSEITRGEEVVLASGSKVCNNKVTLRTDKLEVVISSLGALIESISLVASEEHANDLTITKHGSDFGRVIGRYPGEIQPPHITGKAGKRVNLTTDHNGRHINGGPEGLSWHNWLFEHVIATETGCQVSLVCHSPSMGGYSGEIDARVCYSIEGDGSTLRIRYSASLSDWGPLCLTNKLCVNLRHQSGSIENHDIYVHANKFYPVDQGPVAEAARVVLTARDLRVPMRVASCLDNIAKSQIVGDADKSSRRRIDDYWLLLGFRSVEEKERLRLVCVLECISESRDDILMLSSNETWISALTKRSAGIERAHRKSSPSVEARRRTKGIALDLYSTMPCLHVATIGDRAFYNGMVLQTMYPPNGPQRELSEDLDAVRNTNGQNHFRNRMSCLFGPQRPYQEETIYRFRLIEENPDPLPVDELFV